MKVTDRTGMTWEINSNPWIPQFRNLTHQCLLTRYAPDQAERLKEQAYKMSPEYERDRRKKAWDHFVKTGEWLD